MYVDYLAVSLINHTWCKAQLWNKNWPVEEDEEGDGEDALHDELAPGDVAGVGGVHPEVGHGDVRVSLVGAGVGPPHDGRLPELQRVEFCW